jgi:hypothetical protein
MRTHLMVTSTLAGRASREYGTLAREPPVEMHRGTQVTQARKSSILSLHIPRELITSRKSSYRWIRVEYLSSALQGSPSIRTAAWPEKRLMMWLTSAVGWC